MAPTFSNKDTPTHRKFQRLRFCARTKDKGQANSLIQNTFVSRFVFVIAAVNLRYFVADILCHQIFLNFMESQAFCLLVLNIYLFLFFGLEPTLICLPLQPLKCWDRGIHHHTPLVLVLEPVSSVVDQASFEHS